MPFNAIPAIIALRRDYRPIIYSAVIATIGVAPVTIAAEPVAPFKPASQQAICKGTDGYAQAFEGRRTFLWRPEWLRQIKVDKSARKNVIAPLLANAEKALMLAPLSVTTKTRLPASGNRHDYSSMAPYWWPTAGNPKGEPYSRIDGKVNPERNGSGFDARNLSTLSDAISTLSLAYYYSGDARFSQHAARLVRVWFLEPATRMNPNLAFAQEVPGVSSGRPEGVIDGHQFSPIIESIGLIAPSGALSASEQTRLEDWFYKLVTWMATSENGKAERAKSNNHGIYFDLMIAHFALFARIEKVPEEVVHAFPERRIARQFAPDGSLPEELSRTRSWHYTYWTLLASTQIAGLGECVGLDIWNLKTADGRGLHSALIWAAQYAGQERNWKWRETAFEKNGKLSGARQGALETLRTAAWGLRDPELDAAAAIYAKTEPRAEAHRWLAPYPFSVQKLKND